jgi:hypothetical protein
MLNKIICTVSCLTITSLGTLISPVQAQQPTLLRTIPTNLIANGCDCARQRACQIRQRALTAVPIVATPVAVTPPPLVTPEPVVTPAPEPIAPPTVEYKAPRGRG